MKSLLSKVFAYSVLMLASVAANAAIDDATEVRLIAHANPNLSAIVAAADDDQADSSEAETMLA